MSPQLPSGAPNIIMVMVDQWRADHLGLSGHPVLETPTIDGLFARGTSFNRAYAAVPSCIAARASLLTGLEPCHHGRVGYRENVSWDYDVTLPGVLADAGYQTHCVGKMHVWPARRSLGFEGVELHDGYTFQERKGTGDYSLVDDYRVWLRERSSADADIVDAGIGCNGYTVRPWLVDEFLHPTSWTVTRSIDFLRRRDPTRPFFLKTSFHRPHPPLDPPQWSLDRYADVELPEIRVGSWVDTDRRIGGFTSEESPVPSSEREVDRARRAYLAQLTHIDNQLNRFVHALQEHGVLDSSALIFVSDHGEQLYEHRMVGKRRPYEASARVPMLVRLPGALGGHRRHESDALVELRDVLPTCCDIAGVDVPDGTDGVSLLPHIADEKPARRDHLHGEHHIYGSDDNQWITTNTHKYVWYTQTGFEQLFDLDNDPDECHDLVAEANADLTPFRRALVAELDDREEGFVVDGELKPGAVGRDVLEASGLLSDDEAEAQRTEADNFKAFFDARGRSHT